MKIIEPSIGDHQCCEDLVVALRRWSHARIVPKGSLFFSFYFKKRSVHNYVTVWHGIFAGGGGGRSTKKIYSRKGKLNEKNSCTPINPKKNIHAMA